MMEQITIDNAKTVFNGVIHGDDIIIGFEIIDGEIKTASPILRIPLTDDQMKEIKRIKIVFSEVLDERYGIPS